MSPREAPPDAFGRTAREYELGRPEWPGELVDRVAAQLGLGPGAEVLDLGAGTGKLTRVLVPRFGRVVAVEPDDAMRSVLEEVVPAAEARVGSGESIPLGENEVDAVFSGEAFHWFANDEALAEIVRVLRPRGGLVVLWNYPLDYADLGDEVEAAIDDAFERGGQPGLPRVLSGEWRDPIARAGFEELREESLERDVVRTRDEWIANMVSVSSIAHQPQADRDDFARRLRELIPADREISNRVNTVAYWTRRA